MSKRKKASNLFECRQIHKSKENDKRRTKGKSIENFCDKQIDLFEAIDLLDLLCNIFSSTLVFFSLFNFLFGTVLFDQISLLDRSTSSQDCI